MTKDSIMVTMADFLAMVRLSRSKNTSETYSFAMGAFADMLDRHGVSLNAPPSAISEDGIAWFAAYLRNQSPATEQLYLQAATGFYKFLAAERLADINLARVDLLRRQRGRRSGVRLPQFPATDIKRVLDYVCRETFVSGPGAADYLRALRDRAFLLTLADTGLRVHEACNIRRGEIDWNESRAVIIGKGDKQAVVRFSKRCMQALRAYLAARAHLDGRTGKALASLPLFARHDKGAGSKTKGMTTATGRNIVQERVEQALGDSAAGSKITPHSFRHYFVTTVLRATGNLKLAQELARHASIQVTQRYAHLSDDELDKGYYEVFEKKS